MPKLVVTINQECYRCNIKIQKILACLQDEFCIEKIEFEKGNKVTITGKFDADKLSGWLQCKAAKCIKYIEKKDDKKDEKKDDKKDKKKECKLVHVYPWSYPPCPYPYQPPYGACPTWQGSSSSCYPEQCRCYYCCTPAARPSSPCTCAKCSRYSSCSSDHGHGCYYGSSCSSKPVTPCALPTPLIVCNDDNPSYDCSVM